MPRTTKFYAKLPIEDTEYPAIEGEEVLLKGLTADEQRRIIRQVNEEYEVCYPHAEDKRRVNLKRLRLFNNSRKNPDSVGDKLLFTIFMTVHASLYDDRLMATWKGRSGPGDEDVEENLNALSNYDYDLMQKALLDYYWNFDAEFTGHGLLAMEEFDRTDGIMCPVPDYIDSFTFIHDPKASDVNGIGLRNRGAMRYGGYEFGATYWELKDHPGFFNLGMLRKQKEVNSLLKKIREAHDDAMGRESFDAREEQLGKYDNYEFQLFQWYTMLKGEKYILTLGNQRTCLNRMVRIKGDRWPLIGRKIYPLSSDWDSISIPDLVEDDHRARAVLKNLMLKGAKNEVLPRYAYDDTRIKNKRDLDEKFNKYIPVAGNPDNAIVPVERYQSARQTVQIIMDLLDVSSQRATATPELKQGVMPSKDRTLGEQEMVAGSSDTRYSLSARVYGWSEKEFWNQWYGGHAGYKQNFKDGMDEKMVRIQGMLAPKWRPLRRDNIISVIDPDLEIVSKVIAESKRIVELKQYSGIAGVMLQDPANDRRMIQKRWAKIAGMPREDMDVLFPPTVDELQAEDENEKMENGKLPEISIKDDHLVHIRIHAKAEGSAQAIAHIRAHKRAMIIRRDRPDLVPQQTAPQFNVPGEISALPMKAPAAPTATA